MTTINLSTRIRFTNEDGTLTNEAYRLLTEIINRTGGSLGNSGGDTFVSNDYSSVEGQQSAGGDIGGDVSGAIEAQATSEMTTQPASTQQLDEMVMQPASELRYLDLPQATTAKAPAYKKGRMYFDTTLNKACIGGATAYETITSA
jgi:hypothetical protein